MSCKCVVEVYEDCSGGRMVKALYRQNDGEPNIVLPNLLIVSKGLRSQDDGGYKFGAALFQFWDMFEGFPYISTVDAKVHYDLSYIYEVRPSNTDTWNVRVFESVCSPEYKSKGKLLFEGTIQDTIDYFKGQQKYTSACKPSVNIPG